uniref:Large ribosomal subunit protein uL13 n=1 Tax=Dermatophagoides pteronyssinus TaxID=6956 RepID=A0A6P6YBW7_DERPT|nr:60S ribosomal protein L13a-like [Dermatophagoides pteronyssinus]
MSLTGSKQIVIDGKNHIYGRLAAIVAKKALEGNNVVVVRAEEIIISRSQFRNRLKFMEFLRKHSNSNPTKHSHIHYREPSKMFKRAIRGMLPHKTRRGADALNRISVFEGIPGKFDMKKRVCAPDALKHLVLKNVTPTTRLGDLSSSVGWKGDAVVKKLETKRKEKSFARFEKRKNQLAEFKAKRQNAIASAAKEVLETLAMVQ